MVAFVLQLLSGLCSWLASVLPLSPFAGLELALGDAIVALGWLNWLFPVGRCLQLYMAWLAGALLWQVARFFMKRFTGGLSLFGGGK